MKLKILNYRGGKGTQVHNQVILETGLKDREEAKELLDKEVTWESPGGNKIKGVITQRHGNKGKVIARFEKGMPGQALNDKVEVR